MSRPAPPTIRSARSDEADFLSALCFRSKAHWGYDDAFMAASRATLKVTRDAITAGAVWVAECDGVVTGVVALAAMPEPDAVDLDKLFVEPSLIKSGVGRLLMEFAVEEARRRGFKKMIILADPNAALFYERMGVKFVRQAASDAIPGRLLPLYEIAL
jgi:N-acetylglutamate synthase-like GNAT family acetyltransferase